MLSPSLLIIGLANTTVLNGALPTLQSQLHVSSSSLGCIVDAYLLVFAGLLLMARTLGDPFGRDARAAYASDRDASPRRPPA